MCTIFIFFYRYKIEISKGIVNFSSYKLCPNEITATENKIANQIKIFDISDKI